MEITEQSVAGGLLLKPAGRIDGATAAAFQERLVQAVSQGGVVVDMVQLAYVSSAGLRAFLIAAQRARASGTRIILAAMPPLVREVFDISGFSTIFDIRSETSGALAELAPG